MANIDITDAGGGSLSNGVLQLENGVAMDTTLRYVADQANTKSQLLLATNATTVEGTLKVKTDNVEYLDVEDGSGNNRFTISRPALGQKVSLDFASNPVGSTTIVGSIRTFTDGANLNDIVQFREDGQTTFVERVNVEADSLVTTQTSSVIASTTTNANLVIAPNGTGALIASVPDGTATGGNARGINAVDLQTSRTANTQVASGTNSVAIGNNNTASSSATIAIGSSSTASGVNSRVFGISTSATGESSTAIGASSASTALYSHTFGRLSNATATSSLSLGVQCTASGVSAVAFTGSSAIGSTSFAAQNGNASGVESLAIGSSSFGYLYGQKSFSNGNFGGPVRRVSYSFVSAYRESALLSGGTMNLSLDGSGTTNLLIPSISEGSSRAWNVTIKYIAVVTAISGTATGVTIGDTKSQNIEIGFKRIINTVSLVGAGSYSIAQEDASMNTATLTPTAGGSLNLALTFTAPTFVGGGSVTCAVNAKIELTEVSWS